MTPLRYHLSWTINTEIGIEKELRMSPDEDRSIKLFSPLKIRELTLPNRLALSPLCMYSAKDGIANDWHFAHLSAFARGRVGVIFTEATAVEARGRITPHCIGIWNEEQAEALRPIVRFIEEMGSVPAMQLAHAGRKASTQKPWNGGKPLTAENCAEGEVPWPVVGPSANAVGQGWPTPHALDIEEIAGIVKSFADAAVRARDVGFKIVELHLAHGYLLHSFLSPLANKRTDAYGGDLQGRMRFALEVTEAVRAVWPQELPLFCRLSAIDGPPDGWSIEDSVVLSRELAARGVDVIDCSSGGIAGAPRFRASDSGETLNTIMDRGPGFQVPLAEQVRQQAEIKTMAVGVIINPHQAEQILQSGQADLIAMGRELMYNPFWPLHAAQALGADTDYNMWPDQYRWAVYRRAQLADYDGIQDKPVPA